MVDDIAAKEKQPDMMKAYQIFEWSPGIPIIDQFKNEHTPICNSGHEYESFHSSETNDDITWYEEEVEYSEEEEYEEEE